MAITETAAMLRANQWTRRLGWLLAIWAGSVAGLGLAALALKLFMHVVGMNG